MKVLQIIDSLDMGGAERMAVTLACSLADAGVSSHLCVTRGFGPLAAGIKPGVFVLVLNRRHRFDPGAIRRLRDYVAKNGITHIHAHSTSLAMGWLARLGQRDCRLLWHIHSGTVAGMPFWKRVVWEWLAAKTDYFCCASRETAEWVRTRFSKKSMEVSVLRNVIPEVPTLPQLEKPLPGIAGRRIVCVANLRREKDHVTLLRAFADFYRSHADWDLLLVGEERDRGQGKRLRGLAKELGVSPHVHFLGPRGDVAAILQGCDIGVLSSISEGLPVVLLEYGAAGLPVVATAVGDVSVVLKHGELGCLIPPHSPRVLAEGMAKFAADPVFRRTVGNAFRKHVMESYSAGKVVSELIRIYETMGS